MLDKALTSTLVVVIIVLKTRYGLILWVEIGGCAFEFAWLVSQAQDSRTRGLEASRTRHLEENLSPQRKL